jgi:hypothetical protein
VLLAGNLNTRTGLLQEASSNTSGMPDHIQTGTEFLPPSSSEDTNGGQNFFSRALMELCDTADLAIINGRTLGDANGSYTHHSATTDCIKDLSVFNTVINSDHSYLLLEN